MIISVRQSKVSCPKRSSPGYNLDKLSRLDELDKHGIYQYLFGQPYETSENEAKIYYSEVYINKYIKTTWKENAVKNQH